MIDFVVEVRGTLAGRMGTDRFLRGIGGQMLPIRGVPPEFVGMKIGSRVVAVGEFDEKAFVFHVKSMFADGRMTKNDAVEKGREGGKATMKKYSYAQRKEWSRKGVLAKRAKREARKKLSTV